MRKNVLVAVWGNVKVVVSEIAWVVLAAVKEIVIIFALVTVNTVVKRNVLVLV